MLLWFENNFSGLTLPERSLQRKGKAQQGERRCGAKSIRVKRHKTVKHTQCIVRRSYICIQRVCTKRKKRRNPQGACLVDNLVDNKGNAGRLRGV